MARVRRRDSQRSPSDWVNTGNGWNEFHDLVAIGSAVMFPLTQQAPMVTTGLRAIPQVEQSVVAVRGQVHLWPAIPIAAGAPGVVDMRISVKEADLAGTPQVPAGYDLTSPGWADEQFLWHASEWFVAGGNWLEPEKLQTLRTVNLNVKVRRRLEANQILVMTIQWSQTSQGDPTASMLYVSRLRTLVKYMS